MYSRSTLAWAAAFAFLASAPTWAQTTAPKPAPTTIPEKIAPDAQPTGPAKNLSRELKQSNGVIHPKDVDPAMNKGAPKTADHNVIPPPASHQQAK
jgi:hypothetical protein